MLLDMLNLQTHFNFLLHVTGLSRCFTSLKSTKLVVHKCAFSDRNHIASWSCTNIRWPVRQIRQVFGDNFGITFHYFSISKHMLWENCPSIFSGCSLESPSSGHLMRTHNLRFTVIEENYPLTIIKYPPYQFHWHFTYSVYKSRGDFRISDRLLLAHIHQYGVLKHTTNQINWSWNVQNFSNPAFWANTLILSFGQTSLADLLSFWKKN